MLRISEESAHILTAEMRIDLAHLKAKIESPEITQGSAAISEAIDILCGMLSNSSANDVNEYCYALIDNINAESKPILDSIRMAFFRYRSGGLHDLWVYQENECWYPKIVLKEILHPNDINDLDNEFLIYRGCDRAEYLQNYFGQSWSTNEQVAQKFAFDHYGAQDWFDRSRRVVLWAIYSKNDVLFSNQTENGEFEIVVRPESLTGIEIFLE